MTMYIPGYLLYSFKAPQCSCFPFHSGNSDPDPLFCNISFVLIRFKAAILRVVSSYVLTCAMLAL